MKLSHALILSSVILAIAHVITVVVMVDQAGRIKELAEANVALSSSGSELLAELRTAKSALADKFGDAVAKRAKPRKK